MTYDEFVTVIREKLNKQIGERTSIHLCRSRKPNQPLRESIVLSEESSHVSPMIYLDALYEQFRQGADIDEICEMVLQIQGNCAQAVPFSIPDLSDWENVRDHLSARLINTSKNEDFLKECCCIPIMDLSLIFYVSLSCDDGNVAATVVKKDYPGCWGVTLSEIRDAAFESMRRNDPPLFRSVQDLLNEMTAGSETARQDMPVYESDDDGDSFLFVLTNARKQYGAVWIYDETVRSKIASRLGSFFIIPSSLHECMILPAAAGHDAGQLREMLISVNLTQVSPEDYLGDRVYFCDAEGTALRLAD